MTYLKYACDVTLNGYPANKEPLLPEISFDGEAALFSRMNDSSYLPY